jgi:hypothetical protein
MKRTAVEYTILRGSTSADNLLVATRRTKYPRVPLAYAVTGHY